MPALFCESGPSIGNTYSAQVSMEIFESNANWPRMGKFYIKLRLVSEDGTQQSEWLTYGPFYTDERYYDDDEYLSIVAYDGMLLTEQSWTDKITPQANWPITARTWCGLIQNAGLFTFQGLNNLDDTVALIGLDTTSTIRDVLKTIAAAHGGNWVMIDEQTLKLIPMVNGVVDDTAVVGVAIAGIAVVGNTSSESEDSDSDSFNVGREAADFEKNDPLPAISKVILTTDANSTSEAGTDTGYAIKGNCNFASATGVAALALSRLNGYSYKPFKATGVFLDPAAEPGDLVMICGNLYQIMEMTWDINTWPSVDLAAQFEEEIDHEFTFTNEAAKTYQKALRASTTVLQEWVEGEFAETIEDLTEQIDQKAQTWYQSSDPAIAWTTVELRTEHTGDLWYDTVTGKTYYYNGTTWEQQNIPNEVFDIIDGKSNVFVTQPVPPYEVGDLWVQGSAGDILKCVTAKPASGSYSAGDWAKASKYTDDSALDDYYTKSETQSYIQQNAENIVLGVTETRYYDMETIDTQNQQLSGEIAIEHNRVTTALTEIQTVDGEVEEIQSYIRYEIIGGVGTVVIGQTNSPSEFRVSNEQIAAVYNNEILSYWNQSRQYTPKQLQIPTGGSFRLGNILWQPRTSGNLSIFLTNS